ncbi:MAG: cupin domain-containing protein [Steroidobacteraceae bacterium]|jgi:quercetin dioxygenase-like cupin family protein
MKILKRMMKGNSVHPAPGRRDLLHAAGVGAVVAAVGGWTSTADQAAAATTDASTSARPGIRAFKIYTGPDNASHVLEGTIDQKDRTQVVAIHFKETPAHSSEDWHTSPEPQYVITLSGTLEFTTRKGDTFVLRPGDVLLSEDHAGTGHKWRLIDDQPWRRAYVVLKPGAKDSFVAAAGG